MIHSINNNVNNLIMMFADLPPVESNSTTFVRDIPQVVAYTLMPPLIEEYPFKKERFGRNVEELKTYTSFSFIEDALFEEITESDEGSIGVDISVPLLIKKQFTAKAKIRKVSKFIPKPNIEW